MPSSYGGVHCFVLLVSSVSTSEVRFLFDYHCLYFRDSSQDGNGGAANDASNQESVYSQIKKFQVGTIKIMKYNAARIIIVFSMSD